MESKPKEYRRVPPKPPSPIGVLPQELMLMIFEEIWEKSSVETRRSIRLVCREWNTLALPISYKHITISEGLSWLRSESSGSSGSSESSDDDDQYRQALFENIYARTQHISVVYGIGSEEEVFDPPHYDWNRVAELLKGCQNLKTFKYKSAAQDVDDLTEFPQALTHAFRALPDVKVSIGNFLIFCCEGPKDYLLTKPSERDYLSDIVAFNAILGHDFDGPHQGLRSILVSMNKLEVLELYNCETNDTFPWNFEVDGGTLAPLKELTLEDYLWTHQPEDVPMIWNFSKLESLKLVSGLDPLGRNGGRDRYLGLFLRCVNPEQFPQLRKVSCQNDFHKDVAVQGETDRRMGYFIEHLNKLEDLDISGFGSSSLFPHIAYMKGKLKVLKTSIGSYKSKEVVLPHQLATILAACSLLEELKVSCGLLESLITDGTIHTICGFEKLRRLALEVDGPLEPGQAEPDDIVKYFAEHKSGYKLSRMGIIAGAYNEHKTARFQSYTWSAYIPEIE